MQIHTVKAEKRSGDLKREDQLAWKIAEVAAHARIVELDPDVIEMVKCRLIDNAAIAIAALNENSVAVARSKALSTEGAGNATLYGLPSNRRFHPYFAAFANSVGVRFRDQDDTYLAAEYSHPDDNISPILAVAQQMVCSGKDLIRGIAVAYEVHVALVGTGNGTGICLHKHKVDHMTHIAAATAAGIGAMLKLPTEQIYHAVNFAVHNAISSRQSRKGDIGAQKEFVPGFSAQIAMDAVDSAMQGEKGPNPVYEGVDSIMQWFLNGRNERITRNVLDDFVEIANTESYLERALGDSANLGSIFIGKVADALREKNKRENETEYKIELAEPGKDKLCNILLTYPKEHAFEYQGQAIIDLALEIRDQLPKSADGSVDISKIGTILLETSHHTHHVIGTGANDPQKIDPNSPRGTLDHSIMFAIARSIQLGRWDEAVYDIRPEEKEDLRILMAKIQTTQTEKWETAYHSQDPKEQAFGGNMIINFNDGTPPLEKEKARANAHAYGDKPWKWEDYAKKFETLTDGMVTNTIRFDFLQMVARLENLSSRELGKLTPEVHMQKLIEAPAQGIYSGSEPQQHRVAVGR